MMKRKKIIVIGIILLVVIVFALKNRNNSSKTDKAGKAVSGQQAADKSGKPAIPYITQIFTVERKDVLDTIHVIGDVTGSEDIDFKAIRPARIKEFYFKEGDYVKRGEVIAKLDDEKEYLKQERAKIEYEDNMNLFKLGGVSRSALEKSRLEYEIAKKEYEDLQIKAPFDGILAKRYLEDGQMAASMQNVVRFVNVQSVKITAEVPMYDLSKVFKGQKVYVSVTQNDDEKNIGYIEEISESVLKSTRRAVVRILVKDNKKHRLLPGMFSGVDIVVFEHKALFEIPIECIVKKERDYFVYLIEPLKDEEYFGIIKMRKLKPLYATMQRVFVKEGFKDKDLIVVNPEGIHEGQKVEF